MKIALIFLPAWSTQVAPLGLASISACLKPEGHQVSCFDWNVRLFHAIKNDSLWDLENDAHWTIEDQFQSQILPKIQPFLDQWIIELLKTDYDVVGFSSLRSNRFTTSYVAGAIRKAKPDIKIFVGGPAIVEPLNTMNHFFSTGSIDAAVVGEGEITAIELLKRWQTGQPIGDVMGLVLRDSPDHPVVMNKRPPAMNVNELLIPDFGDFDLSLYRDRAVGIQFSRGCIANCSFCSENSFYWPKFNMKSPDRILREIKHQVATLGVHSFLSADSLMNGNLAALEKLADLIIEDGTPIAWGGNMRVDKRMSPEFLQKMKKANCHWVVFGIESGANPILKAMKKGITHDEIISILKSSYENGIQVSVNIIVGFPGETEEFFQETLKLLESCKEYISYISSSVFGLDPNTHVGKNPEKYGIDIVSEEKIAWDDGGADALGWRSSGVDSTRVVRTERFVRLRAFIDEYLEKTIRIKTADSL